MRGVRGTGARQFHRPWRAPRVRVMKTHRGFTLIELLVAIAVMALIAILSWRGLDGMVRAQEQTRAPQIRWRLLLPGASEPRLTRLSART